LNTAEIATVVANTVRYDIAAAVGSQAHVVAKIRKQVLQQISKP
jgi:hypothetical protein